MINPEKVTQVIVIDYSAKYYPFFELFVSAGSHFDHSSGMCFYTEDENLIVEAKKKLISSDCAEFLNLHLDKIYHLKDAIDKFGKIYGDEMERAVYSAATQSFTIFTPKETQYARKVFGQKDAGQFSTWIVESEKILATTDPNEIIQHTVSVFAFKNSRLYRNYSNHFDHYVKLHNLGGPTTAEMPSVLKLIDAINKNKHIINAELVLDDNKAFLGVNGQRYELSCTGAEYICQIGPVDKICAKTCDDLVKQLGVLFLNRRIVSVGY